MEWIVQPGVFGLVSSVHFAVNYRIQKLLFWSRGVPFSAWLRLCLQACDPDSRLDIWLFQVRPCFLRSSLKIPANMREPKLLIFRSVERWSGYDCDHLCCEGFVSPRLVRRFFTFWGQGTSQLPDCISSFVVFCLCGFTGRRFFCSEPYFVCTNLRAQIP